MYMCVNLTFFFSGCILYIQAFNLSFELSTSQTPVKTTDRFVVDRCARVGGFGTVTDTGYGVSYLVVSDDESEFLLHHLSISSGLYLLPLPYSPSSLSLLPSPLSYSQFQCTLQTVLR